MPNNDVVTTETVFRSLDGLRLYGTLVTPTNSTAVGTVLVHGGGVTRHEGGFFTRLALGLANSGVPSLRFDFRGHGESEGRQEELTISGILNDIRAAVEHINQRTGNDRANIIGASFGGGISGLYAACHSEQVHRLALINPLLNYKKRFIDDKPFWSNDHIDAATANQLTEDGFVPHSPTFKLGRPLLNEVFYLQPHRALAKIMAPTLIVHGTQDTFIPVESSRAAVNEISSHTKLVEIPGAQHGIAVHEDPQYLNPQTQEWQAYVIRVIVEWLTIAD